MSKKVAWLIEPPRQDISDLYSGYEVCLMFTQRNRADHFRDRPEEFYQLVQHWADRNFSPDNYFVLTGNLTMIVMASLALTKHFPDEKLLFLRYDHGLGSYCEVTI